MKQYFTKYLPVEGDLFIVNNEVKVAKRVAENIQSGENMGEYYGKFECKKAKLFLCSRDIQAGDILTHDSIPGVTQVVDDLNKFLNPHEITGQFFKVIGEVSSEAIWVTEGMEFNEDDIKIMKYPDTYISKTISEMLGEKWEHEEESIRIKGKVAYVKIKCQCCNSFK